MGPEDYMERCWSDPWILDSEAKVCWANLVSKEMGKDRVYVLGDHCSFRPRIMSENGDTLKIDLAALFGTKPDSPSP